MAAAAARPQVRSTLRAMREVEDQLEQLDMLSDEHERELMQRMVDAVGGGGLHAAQGMRWVRGGCTLPCRSSPQRQPLPARCPRRAQVRKARIKPGEEAALRAAVRASEARRAAAEQCAAGGWGLHAVRHARARSMRKALSYNATANTGMS